MQQNEKIAALEAENAQLREILEQRDKFIRSTFGSFLTDEVLDEILAETEGVRIGGERRVVSILFSDLRDSTALSEQMAPVDFIRMLNHYLSEMIEIINAWQGNILDFVGDAIVAVFGAPRVNTYSARDAAACAVAMQRRMDAVNRWNREQGYPDLSMGIGLHIGDAILGNIGSRTRMKYDMIGRNVNLASRIQTYTAGGQILVSTEFLEAAGDQIVENEAGFMWVKPKGIQSEILLHDIVGYGSQRMGLSQNVNTLGNDRIIP
jgi:adenylate cyclase